MDNVVVEGRYASFDKFLLTKHDAFLYTSLRDGLPRVLVNAGASGMPAVASDVGGACELLDDETGWLIGNADDVQAYVNALREIRDAPAEAERRGRRLRERVAKDHNWRSFRDGLAIEPGFLAS